MKKAVNKRIRASMSDERICQSLFVCLYICKLQTPTTDKINLRGLRVKTFNIFVFHFPSILNTHTAYSQIRQSNKCNSITRFTISHFLSQIQNYCVFGVWRLVVKIICFNFKMNFHQF